MPQFQYTHPALQLGQVATEDPWTIDSYTNELLAQVSQIVVGGAAAAGDYVITIQGPEGSFAVTYTAAGGEAIAAVVAALVAAINGDVDLLNIVQAVDASPNVTLNFVHPGQSYSVTTTGPNAILTASLVTSAGGVTIPLGTGVVAGSEYPLVVPPGASTTEADVLGITVNADVDVKVNDGKQGSIYGFGPGCTVAVMEEGEVVVAVEDAVAFNGAVFMRIQNPTEQAPLGGFRSDGDGGNAIQITGAKFRGSTSGPGLVRVKINRP